MDKKSMPRMNAIMGKRRPTALCQPESKRKILCTMNNVCSKPNPGSTLHKISNKSNENGKLIFNTHNKAKDGANPGFFRLPTDRTEGWTLQPCPVENAVPTIEFIYKKNDTSEEIQDDHLLIDYSKKHKEPHILIAPRSEPSERYLSIECEHVDETTTENREIDVQYSTIHEDEHRNRNGTLLEPKHENLERHMSIELIEEDEICQSIEQETEQLERYVSIDSSKEEYEDCASINLGSKRRLATECGQGAAETPTYTLVASKRPTKLKTALANQYHLDICQEETALKDLIAASYIAENTPHASGLEMGLDLSYHNQNINVGHNVDLTKEQFPDMNAYTVTEEVVQTTPARHEVFPHDRRPPDNTKGHFEVVEVMVVHESQEEYEEKQNNTVIVNKADQNAPPVPLEPSPEADGICHYMRYETIDGRRTKVFECGICHRGFKHQYTLMRHLPTHTDERNFPCEVCGKAFRQMSTLIQHGAIHSNARPYRCEICSNTFNRVSTLISHKKTHTGNKPHVCTYCGKRFHQKGNLRNHVFTHTNERPYKCEMCGKGFNQKSNLICHRIRYHTAQQEYECEICKERFPKKHALKSHQFYKHAIQYTTGSGRKKLADKTNLKLATQMIKINKNELHDEGVDFNPNFKDEIVYDTGMEDEPKQDETFKLDVSMPHLIINPIKSVAYATAAALGQTMFALYKPFDGPERLMRVASSQSHDKQMLVQATVEDLKATQIPVGGTFSQSTPHQFTVRTVATFVQKYDENGQLEIHEEPEASSCCRIKIEPMYHGMALSAEITGWQDQMTNVSTSSDEQNVNPTGAASDFNQYDSFTPNEMWNSMDWENQLRENANNYESKLMLNAQECYTFSQGNQHFNTALNTEFEPSLAEGEIITPDQLDISSCSQFEGLSSYVEYNYINQEDEVQLSLQTLEVASEPAQEVGALGPFDYADLLP